MVRYRILLALGCLYIVGSAWVIQNEGRSYRDSLRRETPTAEADSSPPAGPDAEAEPVRGAETAAEPARPRPEPPAEKAAPIVAAPPASRAAAEKATPPRDINPAMPPPASPSRPVPSATPPPVRPESARPPPGPPPVPDEQTADVLRWQNDPFWKRAHLTRSWDLDQLSVQDERQLGEELHRLILELNLEDRDAELRRVKEAARPLLDLLGRKDDDYQFFVLNSELANAFSHPGGYIYVSRKLLDVIPEDEPHVLEFVLGHEIAHLELRHALRCLRAPDVRRFRDGTLLKLYFLIIPHGYPDHLEYEADAWAYQRMKQLQYSEHDCLKFLRILDQYAKSNDFVNGHGKPEELLKRKRAEVEGAREFSPVDNHLRSHPAAYERLNRLKALSRRAEDVTK